MITMIISGGQTGADQGGLRAAKACGVKTGGYAPRGFITEEGEAPWLKARYGMIEHSSADYEDRTMMNVLLADGTVIFGKRSQGSNLTERICQVEGQPYLWLSDFEHYPARQKFRLWVCRNKIHTLNIAGNRESRTPGIGAKVEKFLVDVLPVVCK